jgi:hypothetical protein
MWFEQAFESTRTMTVMMIYPATVLKMNEKELGMKYE